jgi:hypothetical protein
MNRLCLQVRSGGDFSTKTVGCTNLGLAGDPELGINR